jgi:hypothetical protein
MFRLVYHLIVILFAALLALIAAALLATLGGLQETWFVLLLCVFLFRPIYSWFLGR